MKIKINGSFYQFFNDFTMSSNLDSVAASFAFTARYNPNDPATRELFRPLSFYPVDFFDENGTMIFSGTMVDHKFNSAAAPSLVSVSGYSKGGVLEDCTIPLEAYPLESLNRTLKEIAERLLKYFGLTLVIYDNVKKESTQKYGKSVAEPSGSIKDYLSKLAAQKNVVLSHDAAGNVILFRPDPNAPSKGFFDKTNTVGDMALEVGGQSIHSVLTSLRQPAKQKNEASSETQSQITGSDSINNPLVKAFRPYVQVLSSGNITDTGSGVKNAFASELKGIKVSFGLNRWENIFIGDIVEIQNDEIFIRNRVRMMVSGTSISESSAGKTMKITLVLPETFTGGSPKDIFS